MTMVPDDIFERLKEPQQILDYVAAKLAAQGGPAVIGSNCCYRSRDRACAAGWTMPDSVAEPVQNAQLNSSAIGKVQVVLGREARQGTMERTWLDFVEANSSLINNLQSAHDGASHEAGEYLERRWSNVWNRGGIATRLSNVAVTWGLDTAKIKEAFPDGAQ